MKAAISLLFLIAAAFAQGDRQSGHIDASFFDKTNEPSLKNLAKENPTEQTYRLIISEALRLDSPTVVRIEVSTDGAALVHTKWLAGRQHLKEKSRNASPSEIGKLLDLLAQANFWEQQQAELVPAFDGYSVVLEGVHGGKYHVIEKWNAPRNDWSTKIAKLMLKIGRSENMPRDW